MKIGLTLGKFAPLHKGHEFLIKEACKQLDGGILYVVLYDDIHYRNIPLQTRADWIRKNDAFRGYNVQVIVGYDSPNDCGDSDEVKNIQENYLLNILGLKDYGITHFFSSEEYGSHVSKALNAIDIRIDMERSNVNISGTMIRNDTYKYRQFISPCVYRDLIVPITFLSGPGSGKTTLVEALGKEFNEPICLEYGREYWEKNNVNRRLSREQMVDICLGHMEAEDKAIMEAKNFCFIDTNPITTYLFSIYYHGIPSGIVDHIAKNCSSRYKHFFLCADDFPFVDTEDRSGDGNRKLLTKMSMDYLEHKKIHYGIVRGPVEYRVRTIKEFLNNNYTLNRK